jgi:hypothetical protein
MADYRAYTIGFDGHFVGCEPMICRDDAEAIANAMRFVDGHDVELWSGEPLVKRFSATKVKGGDAISHEVKDGRMVPKK